MGKNKTLKNSKGDFTKMDVAAQRQNILRTLDFLHPQDRVFELCVISGQGKNKKIAAGWFSNHKKAADWALKAGKNHPEGIYVTLNPCKEEMLDRANHRLIPGMKTRTSDEDITSIKHIFIDVDVDRPSGCSSSTVELKAARRLAKKIRRDLEKRGFPKPLFGMSGNGYHLIYKTNLKNAPESSELHRRFLATLAKKYDNGQVKIDLKVANPARIVKLYGTMACKGKSTPDRPHRFATIISVNDNPKSVKRRQLRAIAPKPVAKPDADKPATPSGSGFLDVRAYLEHNGRTVVAEKPHGSATLFVLETCIFNPNHGHREAAIGQTIDGLLFYHCFHNTCKPHTWREARQQISGNEDLSNFCTCKPKPETNVREHFSIITAKDIMKTPEKEKPIINGLLSERENLLIVGPSGIGKSLLTLNIGLNLGLPSPNKFLWGMFTIPDRFKTLFIQSENSLLGIRKRLGLIFKGNHAYRKAQRFLIFPEVNGDCRVAGNIATQNFQDFAKEMIYTTRSKVVVVDPLISFHHANENDNTEVRKALDALMRIIIETQTALVLIHHVGKSANGARGASSIIDWADNILDLERGKKDRESLIKVTYTKGRHSKDGSTFNLERTGTLDFRRWFPPGEAFEGSVREALVELGGTAKTQQLLAKQMEEIGLSHAKAIRLIKKAVESGLVEEVRQGKAVGYKLVNEN